MLRSSFFFLLLSSLPAVPVSSDTVRLANCPQESQGDLVIGDYYNNGQQCVRDRQVLEREVIPATCPDEHEYRNGWCRPLQRHHVRSHKIKPECPAGYQRFSDKCQANCPSKLYKQQFEQCILPRDVLNAKYMTCPPEYHRYESYCCIPGQDCPLIECNLNAQSLTEVPGKFFYNATLQKCERQAQSESRVSSMRPKEHGGKCPEPLVQVWGRCQEACPPGYRSLKGKCELGPCVFDPQVDKMVTCPEGSYKVSQAML